MYTDPFFSLRSIYSFFEKLSIKMNFLKYFVWFLKFSTCLFVWFVSCMYWFMFLPTVYVRNGINPVSVLPWSVVPLLILSLIFIATAVAIYGSSLLKRKSRMILFSIAILGAPLLAALLNFTEEEIAFQKGRKIMNGEKLELDDHVRMFDGNLDNLSFKIKGTLIPIWSIDYRKDLGWFYIV